MAPSSCGFLLEYPLIRVDRFTPTPVKLSRSLSQEARSDLPDGSTHFPPPRFYLLTHIHTDHLQGLESFANDHAPIYCSPITKAALLRFERAKTRAERDRGEGSIRRPYSHLRITEQQAEILTRETGKRVWARDILHAIPLRTPTIVPYAGREMVRLTLLDSNHMAGGVLFLVEGSRGAVIHAGDMRAEPWYCNALVREPCLAPYIAVARPPNSPSPTAPSPTLPAPSSPGGTAAEPVDSVPLRIPAGPLLNIYVDDEALGQAWTPMNKHEAVSEIVALMRLYPPCTRFFLDCWCWGYEDLIKAINRAFRSRIHVDRYKKGMYSAWSIEDPHLASMVTTDDEAASRFHACERTQRCALIDRDSSEEPLPRPLIVEIAPPSFFMPRHRWAQMRERYNVQIASALHGKAAWPERLVMPFERHSPLVETRHFVRTFSPRNVTPNTGRLQHHFILAKVCAGDLHRGDSSVAERAAEDALGSALWRFYSNAWDKSSPAPTPSTHRHRAEAIASESDEVQSTAHRLSAFHVRARQLFKNAYSALGTGLWEDEEKAAFEDERERMLHRTDDVSQNESILTLKDHQEEDGVLDGGYEGDVSGVPASTQVVSTASAPVPIAPRAALAADNGSIAAPPRKRKRRKAGPTPAALDDELACRYLAYLGMFLGWKLYNPNRYSQPRAWRAVRRQKPKLARQAERSLKVELGIEPPVWNEEELEAEAKAEAESQARSGGAEVASVAPQVVTSTIQPAPAPQAVSQERQEAVVSEAVAEPSQTPSAAQPRRPLAERSSNQPPTPTPSPTDYGELLEALRSGRCSGVSSDILASHLEEDLRWCVRCGAQGDEVTDRLARSSQAASLLGLALRSKKAAKLLALDAGTLGGLTQLLRAALEGAERERRAERAREGPAVRSGGVDAAVERSKMELVRTLRWCVRAVPEEEPTTRPGTEASCPPPAQKVPPRKSPSGPMGVLSPSRTRPSMVPVASTAVATATATATATANRSVRFAASPSPVKRMRMR